MTILAQLAGHTGDPKFHDLLLPQLDHPDREVREAAAVHLCRLGDARGLKSVLETFRRDLADIPEAKQHNGLSPGLVEAFMAIHIADTDEAVSAVGDALASWRRRPVGKGRLSSLFEDDSEAVLKLMLATLGCSKRPRAIEYLVGALRDETRSNVQAAILAQLRAHEGTSEFRSALMTGVEQGHAVYFSYAPHSPEITALVARKLLAPELKAEAFSAAVVYLTYDEGKPAEEALRRAYQQKLHADDPELWIAVLCGLARHGGRQHLQEAFGLLVKVEAEPLPSPADKTRELERKRRLDLIARSVGNRRFFPSTVVADFLHTQDADSRPAVREAIKAILEADSDVGFTYKTLPALPDGVVRLAQGDDAAKGTTTYRASGFGMKFTRPDREDTVIAIELHAGRFNEPAKEFHVYLLGENQEVLRDLTYPIARMPWGGQRWYHFDIPPTEVPKHFMVGFDFDPRRVTEKAAGILLDIDPTVPASHSLIGTPQSGYKPLEQKADWIMRVLIAPRSRARQIASPSVSQDQDSRFAKIWPCVVTTCRRP